MLVLSGLGLVLEALGGRVRDWISSFIRSPRKFLAIGWSMYEV